MEGERESEREFTEMEGERETDDVRSKTSDDKYRMVFLSEPFLPKYPLPIGRRFSS